MALPEPGMLIDCAEQVDIEALLASRKHLQDQLAVAHHSVLIARFEELDAQQPDSLDASAIAARRLKGACLHWLARVELDGARAAALYARAHTLTDRLSALTALVHNDAPRAGDVLEHFAQRVETDLLLTDKWLGIVATRPHADAIEHVQQLLSGPHWLPRNPNRVRAIIGNFVRNNLDALHRHDGAGYALLCGRIPELDAINPQVAARQIGALEYWRKLDEGRRRLIEIELRRLQALPLSNDMQEMLGRLLA
jgi:aminopeptidase N